MFFWFTNFYRRFINDFSKIEVPLTLILKMTFSASARPGSMRSDNTELNTNSGSSLDDSKINNKIANLVNTTKKMNVKTDCLTFRAKKTFIHL